MSIIQENLNPVSSPEETLPEFLAETTDPRIGLEVETHFVDRRLNAATVESYRKLAADVEGRAEISLEAASTLFEVKNQKAKTPEEGARAAAAELTGELAVIEDQVRTNDHIMLPHSVLPWSNFEDLAKTHIHPGPNPRPTSFIDFFMANDPARARNFITVAGQQASLTHRTPTDTLRYYNRLAHLTPLLSSVMSTVPPYAVLDDSSFGAVKSNIALARRLQTAGGADKAFPLLANVAKINESEAERFMSGWNDYVWDTPIFSYYDPDDKDEFTRLKHFEPAGTMISFRDLPKRLQTRENFNMASSIQYGLITMSHIPPCDGHPDRRRVEARLYDTGTAGQIRAVAGLSFALAFDEEFGERVDRFVSQRGFYIDTPSETMPALTSTLEKAATLSFDNLKDLPYGHSDMRAAAVRFRRDVISPMLDKHPELAALDYHLGRGKSPALDFRDVVSDEQAFADRIKSRNLAYTEDQLRRPNLAFF